MWSQGCIWFRMATTSITSYKSCTYFKSSELTMDLDEMNVDDSERFNAITKLIDEYGYPIPCYCSTCKKPMGFYFKTGSGRWDGRPANVYCMKCGKEKEDSMEKDPLA